MGIDAWGRNSWIAPRRTAVARTAGAGLGGLATALLAAACSSGGGSGPARSVAFVSGSSSTAEGDAHVVSVRLNADEPPPADVTVLLSDASTGSATAGDDYASFAPVTVTFVAGTLPGTTQAVGLPLLGDAVVEGADETLDLELSSPDGAALGATRRHTVTLLDDDVATIAFSSAASDSGDESPGPRTVTLVLDLAPGGTLGTSVSARVEDHGSGSATPGVDYAPFSPQTVTFPMGSADGATRSVSLVVQDDAAVESDETAVLALTSPSTGAALGATQNHTLTIVEDDVSPVAFLSVTLDGAPATSGDDVDLGSQSLGGGVGDSAELVLENLGGTAASVSVLSLTGSFGDFTLDLETDGLPAALPPEGGAFPLADLGSERPLEGLGLALDPDGIAALAEAGPWITLAGVPLPGGGWIDVELERLRSPWSPTAVLRIDGVDVPGGPDALLGDLSLWRGRVAGEPDSSVFLSFSTHGSRGWIRRGDGTLLHLVSDAEDGDGAAAPPAVRLVDDRDLELGSLASAGPPPFLCGGALEVPGAPAPAAAEPPTDGLVVGFGHVECRLAVETDYQFFQKFGSSAAAATYATELFASVGERYESQAQTVLAIQYLGIYTSAADPWTSQDSGGSTSDLLAEFRGAWTGGGWPVSADLAHFLSGATIGGGIAYIGVLCNASFGFGVSGNLTGGIDWSTFTGQPSVSNWDFVVVAHELGHNFGALHTHSYCPPLDHCQGNCDGTVSCPQGTLMSYCHLCGGMSNVNPRFHPHVANNMRLNVLASCLGPASLAAGGQVHFTLGFDPSTGTGSKAATLSFTHGAANVPSPFTLDLSGQATP